MKPPAPLSAAWRPGGLLYLAVVLGGLAAGLWPQAIAPSPSLATPLPTLQALSAAQAAFILLLHPLISLHRAQRGRRHYWREVLAESAVLLVVTAPLYLAAAFLADATPQDVLRVVIYMACLWCFSWAAGRNMARSGGEAWIWMLALLIVAALPAAYYVAREFLAGPKAVRWLWELAPVTFAWQTAGPRQGAIFPRPAWAALIWPALSAACLLLDLLRRGPRQ